MTQMDPQEKAKERQRLAQLVRDWNQEHYDIFELSQPNENLEFHGVVRFYFQDGANVVTKCIRVASSATTQEVVDVLVEKFRPDMRMLTANKYALYEVHANGDERRLQDAEKVLYVQLNWGSDVREGRFLLKKEGVPTISPHADKENQNFKRKLSKREKKEKKKLEKEQKKNEAAGVAEKLYTEMPETRFTRSISNPEAVMKRRRQQKVEKKLQQCRGQDGQGGTLKIYGETIRPDVPYKTLLLSTADTVNYVIKETMGKYGLEKEDPDDYCLYKVLVPPGEREYHGGVIGEERIMEEYECPLAIAMDYPPSKGTFMFHLKRRPQDSKKKTKRQRAVSHDDLRYNRDEQAPQAKPPYLEELNPDGSENPKGKLYHLKLKYTEVGSDPSMPIRIQGPSIMPRHCVISLTQNDGIVMVMPASPDAEMYVNNMRIFETTTLQNGMVVRFGKINFFRFLDPNYEEKLRRGQIPPDGAQQKRNMPQQMQGKQPLETDLDADVPMNGHVPHHAARPQEPMEVQQSRPGHQQMSPRREERGPPPPQQRQIEDLLPAALEFRDDKETDFFAAVILDGSNAGVQFKLAPTYVIYMAVRYCITGGYRSDLGPQEKAIATSHLVSKIADFVTRAIHESRDNPAALAFWMANSSEILHFYKQDNDVQPFSQDAQEILAESVQLSFQHLVKCLQYDLQRTMPAFLEDHDDEDMNGDRRMQYNRRGPILEDVLDTLSSAMNLLRRCRVNAALTIQLFSQLFHFINMWLFNILVREPNHQLCTRLWGQRLKRRLGSIEAWAEKQGLELAADCHLCRISQAAHLLQAAKSSPDDITNITSTCFKLNSYQVRELLVKYISEPDEPPIPQSLIEGVVKIAENMADAQIKNDGREICLEEDADLQLPFLLPEDGYSCDTIKGIPKGLDEFIEPLARAGLCRLTPQPGSSGSWTIYMNGDEGAKIDEAVRKGQQQQQQHQQPPVQQHPQPGQGQGPEGSRPQPQLPREPEVANVTFSKVKGSMGLSIVAAVPKGEPQKESGIYIKSVVPGGAAALDGRLQAGDQLLEVDGKSLVGLSQERAAELMTRTGQTVTLKVAKQGAFYHGLATLLSQPSPVLPRASPKKPSSPQVGKHRPHEEGPPPYNGNQELDRNRPPQNKQQMMAQSRSSPALNSDNMGPGGRAVSMGNIRDQPQHSPHGHRMPPGHHGNNREPDPKSKSIPNLRMDNSFDHREPSHHQQQQHMRPAASVGALQHPNPAFHEYYNQGRPDPRGNDYENHPSMDPRMQRGQPDPRRNERDYQDMSQTLPPGLMGRGQVRHGSDGPPSSRNSGSSFRDDRPQSAYFGQGQMEKPDYRDDRPKSMEVTLDRVQDLHQRFGPPQHSPHQSPHESSFENDRDPNYMNTRAQRQHQMQSGYVNQSDIPKFTAHNEARQPNFYENTSPRQNEPSPAFHQLKRPPFENENKTRPQPMPKPSVAPKPNAPKAIPADIPRVDVDNRQTQSHFFEPHMHQDPRTMQNSDPRMQRVPTSHHQNFIPGQPHLSHSQGMNSLPHQKHSPGREMYVQPTHQSPELPPPPQEIPPELPPPPAPEDLPEELPPLPPPPVNDYRLDSMDPQYANQADPRSFGSQPGYPHHQLNQPQQRGQPHVQDNRFGNRENPDRQRIMGYAEPQRQQPQLSMAASVPRGFQPNNDYQNISYERQNKVFNAPSQHSPGQNVYESYDPKSGKPQGMDIQQSKHRLMAEVNDFAKSKKDGVSPLTSPWDREEMEKSQKVREEEMNRLRELEIQDLESRPYLAPQEQDRLRKLRLEQEFQRRVQEVSGRDEDEEDSDTDITNRSQGREFLMQTIQEDIVKAQRRLEDLNHKQQYEEYQQEKERMLRLERKLEIFEQEREERQNRLQKRQEKKQKEQEDYQRKQRELREKQRQEYEDQKRAMQLEEEKVKRRQQEEERRRKEFEKERLQEIEAQKEREEAAARAEIRRREEEFQRQQMEQRERERREQEREIRVNEERKRLDAMSQGYQPYANLPATQSQYGAPPPPQRGSSYDITNNTSMGRSAPNFGRNDLHQNNMNSMNNGFRNGGPNANSSMKMQENSVFVPKKSVSFNTQLETRNTYSVGSESRGSQSSYRTNSVSSDQNEASSPNVHNSFPQTNNVNDSVFTSTNSTPQQNHVQYRTSEGTPNVVGAQEVYRDPRNRIQAQREAQDKNVIKKSGNADRMSFRDKMKFFAQEAGEGTPKDKSRVSKTLRDIESQLHNGQ